MSCIQATNDEAMSLLKSMCIRLDSIEKRLALNVEKEAYTTAEVASRIDRAEWTVRQWCNKGRIRAKRVHGKGRGGEWRITREELERIQKDGPSREGTFAAGGAVAVA